MDIRKSIREGKNLTEAYNTAVNEVYRETKNGNLRNADIHRVEVAKAFAETYQDTGSDTSADLLFKWINEEFKKVDIGRIGTSPEPKNVGTDADGSPMNDNETAIPDSTDPTKTLDDLVGEKPRATAREVSTRIRRVIEYPESPSAGDNETLLTVGLIGKPGVGKSLLTEVSASLARDLLNQDIPYYPIGAGELKNHQYGGSQAALRQILHEADANGPSIVFIDEIDELASRDADTHETTAAMLTTLLRKLDGPTSVDDVVVIYATNKPKKLDSALLSRTDLIEIVPNPSLTARKTLFVQECQPYTGFGANDLNDEDIETLMEGMTGRDITRAADHAFQAAADRDEDRDSAITIDREMAKRGLKRRWKGVAKLRKFVGPSGIKSGLDEGQSQIDSSFQNRVGDTSRRGSNGTDPVMR